MPASNALPSRAQGSPPKQGEEPRKPSGGAYGPLAASWPEPDSWPEAQAWPQPEPWPARA
jgi:hypothetical protein